MIDHEHGTPARYAHGTSTEPPCREACCREAKNAYDVRRRKLRAYGRSSMTDAAPVRAHVEELVGAGLKVARVAALAGVSQRAVRVLLGLEKALPPSRTVRVTTAEKLLAVAPTLTDLAPQTPTAVHATRRRLQALVAGGRPLTVLAVELGTSYSVVHDIVHGKRRTIRASTAIAVREMTERLWDQPPPAVTEGDRRRLEAAARLTARFGWVPLMAWDEDAIEDPKGRPQITAQKIAARRAEETERAAKAQGQAS